MTNNPLDAEIKKIQRVLEDGTALLLDDMSPDIFRGRKPGTVIAKQKGKTPEIIIVKGILCDFVLFRENNIRGVRTDGFNIKDMEKIGFKVEQAIRVGLEPELGTETYRHEEAQELLLKLRNGDIVTIDFLDPKTNNKRQIRLGRSLALVGKENYHIGLLISPAIIRKISNTSKNTPATIGVYTNKIVPNTVYTDKAMSDAITW